MKSRTKKKRRAREARETRLDYVYYQSSHRWIYMAQLGFTIRSNMVLTITGPKWTKVPLGAEPERAPNRIDFVPPDPDRPR
jgi:hypothetical protein